MSHYFDQLQADPSDLLLKDAIDRSIVPIGCLLSGALVLMAADLKKDPCGSCSCPRSRCGGRPKTDDAELDTAYAEAGVSGLHIADDASRRRMTRLRIRQKLTELCRKEDDNEEMH